MRSLLLIFLRFPYKWGVVFLLLLSRFFPRICHICIISPLFSYQEFVELVRNVDCFNQIWEGLTIISLNFFLFLFLLLRKKFSSLFSLCVCCYALWFPTFLWDWLYVFILFTLCSSDCTIPIHLYSTSLTFLLIYICSFREWMLFLGYCTSQLLNFHYLKIFLYLNDIMYLMRNFHGFLYFFKHYFLQFFRHVVFKSLPTKYNIWTLSVACTFCCLLFFPVWRSWFPISFHVS